MGGIKFEDELSNVMMKERGFFEKAFLKLSKIKNSPPIYAKTLRGFSQNQRDDYLNFMLISGTSLNAVKLVKVLWKKYPSSSSLLSKSKVGEKKAESENANCLISRYKEKVIRKTDHAYGKGIAKFTKQFHFLKNDLIKRTLKETGEDFLLHSPKAKAFYENHVAGFDSELEFSNAGLIAFAAFNRLNSSAPANENLWKTAMYYVGKCSPSITNAEGVINELEISEMRSLLIDYMSEGGRLCDEERANTRSFESIRDNDSQSIPIKVLKTIKDLTKIVSKLPNPTIEGFCDHLHGLAVQNKEEGMTNVWSTALESMCSIHGHGTAIASNFLKDFMLWKWNQETRSFEELRTDVTAQTNKPDIHVKRIVSLILQPWLFKTLAETQKDYRNFAERDAEALLKMSGDSDTWQDCYFEVTNDLCEQAMISRLELDRVFYGLMSGHVAGTKNPVQIKVPSLKELEELLHIEEELYA